MKKLFVIFLFLFSSSLWAGCESSIIEGGHTALLKKEAKAGALEEAIDKCYPGKAQKLGMQCKKLKGDKGINGQTAFRCTQQLSCNICDEALKRKNEALY